MTELVMRKRGAHRVGELGLFIDSEVFEEEFATINQGAELEVKATSHRSLHQLRYAWALCAKVSEACDWLSDRQDCMDYLKMKARHVRYVVDHRNGQTMIIPKSIRFASMDQTAFQRLMNRMVHIIVSEIIPGLDESALRSEIEQMVGITPPAPKPRRRATRSQQEPANVEAESLTTTAAGSITEGGEAAKGGNPSSQSNLVDNPPAGDGNHLQAGLPTTPNEWSAYAKSWLNRALADKVPSTEITRRWSDEQALRQQCGVSHKALGPVFDLYVRIVEVA